MAESPPTGQPEVIRIARHNADVSCVAGIVFGRLVRTAMPVLTGFESDLFYDATWLHQHLAGRAFTFFWSVNPDGGTAIGTDPAAAHGPRAYRVTVAVDTGKRTTLLIESLIGIPPARLAAHEQPRIVR